MGEPSALTMTFKLELFVADLSVSAEFYRRVLGFSLGEPHPDGYTPMSNGGVRIALNRLSGLAADHPIQLAQGERPGRGVELVLEVDDVNAMYRQVCTQGWPLSSQLQRQHWGATDFRIRDPDGYYWRITSRESGGFARHQ